MAFIEGGNNGNLNSATPVVIVSAPIVGRRIVRSIIIHNSDAILHVLTVYISDSTGSDSIIWKGDFDWGDTWFHGEGEVLVLDSPNKSIKAVLDGAAAVQPTYETSYGDAI